MKPRRPTKPLNAQHDAMRRIDAMERILTILVPLCQSDRWKVVAALRVTFPKPRTRNTP